MSLLSIRRQHNFIRTFTGDDPADDATIFQFGAHRFIATHDAGTWKDQRFQQVSSIAYTTNARQIRAQSTAAVAQFMASAAGRFLAHEHLMTSAKFTFRQCGQHRFQHGGLLFFAGIQQLQKSFTRRLNGLGILRQQRLDQIRPQASHTVRVQQRFHQLQPKLL